MKPSRGSSRLIEDEVEIHAFWACRIALEIVKEAQPRGAPSSQGIVSDISIKEGSTITAVLRSAKSSRGDYDFEIPKDFTAGDLLSSVWAKPWYFINQMSLTMRARIWDVFLSESSLRTQSLIWGHKLISTHPEGQGGCGEGGEDLEEGDEVLKEENKGLEEVNEDLGGEENLERDKFSLDWTRYVSSELSAYVVDTGVTKRLILD